jgi:hypothetical protein
MAKNDYIDNKKMLKAFIDHRARVEKAKADARPEPKLPDYIGECFQLLAERIGSRGNFSNYTYLDEMKEDGIESCIIGANNFDPVITQNPFGYFSKAIWFAFLRRIEKEQKQNYIKFKLKQNLMSSTDENLNINGGPDDLKVMDNVISNFEDKKKKKKEKNPIEQKKNGTRLIKKRKILPIEDDGTRKKQNTSVDLIADFIAKGGKISYLPTGQKSGAVLDGDEENLENDPEEVKTLINTDDFEEYGEETADE